jgi:transposase
MDGEGRWYVGIDWASEEHQVCLLDADGEVLGERVVAHSGDGLAELCSWLGELTGSESSRIHVSIEVPHGAVVETLLERGFVVHAINPKQLDRFRDRFTVAGAKDDRRDARVLADSLRTDARCFRQLRVDEPLVIELREMSRMAEDLKQEQVRFGHRVRQQLRRYYPQMLEIEADVSANWFLDLWELVPTPEKARRVRESSIARVLRKNRIRKTDAASVRAALQQTPLRVAPGTTEAATTHIQALVERMRLGNKQLRDCYRTIDKLCTQLSASQETTPGQKREQRDVQILSSLPGVGRIVLATLLAEASQPLQARDYHAIRSLSGTAPVTRQSGKRTMVVMRKACHHRLRNALYHWARVAVQRDARSRQRYSALRERGHSHGRALRSVADRLLAVACAMLRAQTEYDPERALLLAA